MTDLTALQAASQLRVIAKSEHDHWYAKVATLIDQQAEHIAGLEQTARVNYGLYKSATEDLDEAESEVAALQKVIQDAPHGYPCSQRVGNEELSCACWKSKALAKKEDW